MGGMILTLSNRSAQRFLWSCLGLMLALFVCSSALHRYENRSAATAEVEYRLCIAARLSEYGMSDEQTAEIVASEVRAEEISAGEKILSDYGYYAGSAVGGEYAYFPYLASDLLTASGALLCLTAGLLCIHTLFRDVRKLTDQLEHERDITLSDEHDIGILAEAAAALKAKTEHLLTRLNDEKQYLADYLNDFSHQIKTPCTGLKLNNEILLSAPMPFEEQRDYLLRDRKCLERISLLTAESLKLARLEAGAVQYNFEDTDISVPTAEAVTQLAAIAAENEAEIINEVESGIILRCDRLWLCEAITNLVKNAAEHTHGGQVRIHADSDPMSVRLYIEDNGCGISEEELPKVFKRFWSKSNAVNGGSVGIGMSAAKKMIEDMNGRIYIESELGKGTKIKLEFLRLDVRDKR